MPKSTPEQLRFPPVDGLTVRADFDGGAMSSDVGPLILRGVDQQIGLTERLAQAVDDQRQVERNVAFFFVRNFRRSQFYFNHPPGGGLRAISGFSSVTLNFISFSLFAVFIAWFSPLCESFCECLYAMPQAAKFVMNPIQQFLNFNFILTIDSF